MSSYPSQTVSSQQTRSTVPVVSPWSVTTTFDLLLAFWEKLQRDDLTRYLKPLRFLHVYHEESPLVLSLLLCFFLFMFAWVGSLITRNYSIVDRLWSIIPVAYTAHFAFYSWFVDGEIISPRLGLMFYLTLVWGLRLSYNFYRKGGYSLKGEDYRWEHAKKMMGPIIFQLCNFFFIALYQNILLLWIALPAYIAWLGRATPLNFLDLVAGLLFMFFFSIEAVADEQQWAFQTTKHNLINNKRPLTGDYASGFVQSGLFRYSRHPNFFSEQAIWWCFYLFSVAATGEWLNWSILGAIQLTGLFQATTAFTEGISEKKYPQYKQYQKTTSRLLPLPPSSEKRD